MKLKTCLAALALTVGMGAAAPAVAEVNVVQIPSAALARGSTYAWAPVSGIVYGAPAPAVVNEITAGRLAVATQSTMSERGFVLVQNPSQADLIVVYQMITAPQLDGRITPQGGACEPLCQGARDYRISASESMRGTLVLDIYERRTGRLVYRATSEKTVSPSDTSQQRLNALLKRMTRSLALQE